MLELRPNCEACDKDLPPDAADARICSYECTFCAGCVETEFQNVCPNCGGGFEKRPVRPATAWRDGVGLPHQPATNERKSLKYDRDNIAAFVAEVKDIPPAER